MNLIVQNIKKKINSVLASKYALISIELNEDPKISNVLIVNNFKKKLSIDSRFNINTIEELSSKIPKNIPLIINFFGEKVLTQNSSNIDLIHEVYSLNTNNFYTYKLIQDNKNFLSICRKNIIDSWLNELNQYYVLDYSIGPYVSVLFNNILDDQEKLLCVNNGGLVFNNGVLDTFKTTTDFESVTYKMSDQEFSHREVASFSTLINYLFNNKNLEYDREVTTLKRSDYKFKKYYDFLLPSTVVVFLIVLIINFSIKNSLEYDIDYLTSKFDQYRGGIESYNEYKTKVNEKEALINLCPYLYNKNFLSFYTYNLGNSLPRGLSFTKLQISPVKELKLDKLITIENNFILILGKVNDKKNFNDWVSKVKKFKWVNSIEIIFFKNNIKKGGNNFQLKILVN